MNDCDALKKSVNGILLLYSHSSKANAPTLLEHINSFKNYSERNVCAVNLELGFPMGLSDLSFDVIVLHYSLFGSFPYELCNRSVQYIKEARESYKVVFFQDEHRYCQQRFSLINRVDVDCIYTLLDPQYFDDVYHKYTDVRQIIQTLTGYVDGSLVDQARRLTKPPEARSIDVGYRARSLPFWMGKGAQEKTEIAEKFLCRVAGLGLNVDVKTGEKDRIYGDAWHQFVSNCRVMIGVEAGASVFDIDNVARPAVERMLAVRPQASFADVHERLLLPWENVIPYRTISPRVFEAAAFRVCQVLYEGDYQGILQPMVHYIPLKKDFSNFDNVIRMLRDQDLVRRMTENAYDDLIASGRYSYEKFIRAFDGYLTTLGVASKTSSADGFVIEQALRRDESSRMLLVSAKRLLRRKWPGKALVRELLCRLNYMERV